MQYRFVQPGGLKQRGVDEAGFMQDRLYVALVGCVRCEIMNTSTAPPQGHERVRCELCTKNRHEISVLGQRMGLREQWRRDGSV